MHAVLGHLVRRGFEATSYYSDGDEQEYKLPGWAIVMFAITFFSLFALSSAIEYTFGRLVPTLVMVESPQAVLYEPLNTIDPDAPISKNPDPELVLIKQQPITSSFRGIIKHLKAKGGFRARFRGVGLFAFYSFALAIVSNMIVTLPFVPRSVAHVFGAILLANLSLTWTHIVISDPSPKPWFRRLPTTKVWKKVAGPTALLAVAEGLTVALPGLLSRVYGLGHISHQDATNMSGADKRKVALQSMSILVLGIVLGFFLVIPANVILTRVQASLLPDDQESVVPFDRSFAGKVTPEIVGGTGVVSIRDAWTTFDRNACVRLIKTYAKVFAMQIALMFFFAGIFMAQILLVIGKSDFNKIINNPKNGEKTPSFL